VSVRYRRWSRRQVTAVAALCSLTWPMSGAQAASPGERSPASSGSSRSAEEVPPFTTDAGRRTVDGRSAQVRRTLREIPRPSPAARARRSAPKTASFAAANVVGPESDSWSYLVDPRTLECSAYSDTLRKGAWTILNNGYCGTFVSVDGVVNGMDVRNMPFQSNSLPPLPYTL
jgi:hypothetical protein